MVITPFGDLEYNDQSGLQDWLDAHDQRHFAERQRIATGYGIPLFPRPLTGPMSSAWFGWHMTEHTTLMDFAPPDQTVGAVVLEMQWTTPDNFYRWHQIHNLLHQQLDQALGIYA